MNILIIGGLLALAVVAILGAVLLGISEDRAEKARKANEVVSTTMSLPQQSPSRQLEEPVVAPQTVPLTPLLTTPTGQLPSLDEDERLAALNGQMRALTSELRALAQRAGELEQRLNDLSAALERHQRPAHPSGHLYTSEADAPAF